MAKAEKYVIPVMDPPEQFYWGEPIDRQTAKSLGLKRYFTGNPCKKGHVAERWVSSLTCIECALRRHRTPEYLEYVQPVAEAWREENPDLIDRYNAQRRKRREDNPEVAERHREKCREWYAEKSQDPEWRAAERERLRQYGK